ncbi:MAG TPA: acetate--CoA ligase [Caldilineae bacterium]|nr:acetate--CoA ligase [Caldilineae bacterium]
MLEPFVSPKAIAIIGASSTPGKLGYAILQNVLQYGFPGAVYPINPKRSEVLGLKAYPSVLDVPGPVDLAVIVIPSQFVAKVLDECGRKGIRGVIIISAGFREIGSEGLQRERELIRIAQQYGMRIIGPNCLGIIDTLVPLNASFAATMPDQGSIAFMSQSGALCTSILDMAKPQGIGFSRFVSLGNKADLNEIDFLEAWADDPHSSVITAYLEGITDGPRFMEVARRVTKKKPVITIKSGTTSAGSRAVSSHTGTLAGSDRAYEAAFKQTGVIRARSVQELFDFASAFARQPIPESDRVAVVTNAGGPGIMCTDALEQMGLCLASLTEATRQKLSEHLPAAASVLNPIDVLGDALADRYELAVEAAANDPNVGAVIVILTPQFMTEIEKTAEAVVRVSQRSDKPILGCFMGEANVGPGIEILNKGGVPNYQVPERAAAALAAMWSYRQWLEQPEDEVPRFEADRESVRRIFEKVRSSGRVTMSETEARGILQAYGIPMPRSELARSAEEAVEAAERIGYPVVMKIASPDILHKTDIGGVKLNLLSASDVRDAFDLIMYRATRYMPNAEIWGCLVQQQVAGGREVILGMSRDPQFGPLLLFGLGGVYVEALKDVTFRVAPIGRRAALEMMQEIRAYTLLRGVRGEKPADLEAVADIMLRLSQLVSDFPEIVELDVNPLKVFDQGRGALALDIRLVLAA